MPTPASASAKPTHAAGPQLPRPLATAISATSAGMAPTISEAWLTLVCVDARVLEHDHDAVADRARERGSAA